MRIILFRMNFIVTKINVGHCNELFLNIFEAKVKLQ